MAAGSRVALIALFTALCCAAPVRAQQLARLHVQSMTLASDKARPQVGVPFDLVLTIRVRENVPRLDNVVLPSFSGPEELGDERVVSHGAGGTIYRETLRLAAHSRGDLAIGPGYMDAIDARDGKPKRFLSNGLMLRVEGGPLLDPWSGVRDAAKAIGELALIAGALAATMMLFRRRTRIAPVTLPAPVPVPPPEPPTPIEFRLRTALETLGAQPTRESLHAVRVLLWEYAGAPRGGTLADALSASNGEPAHLRAMLAAVERATFTEDWQFGDAVARVLQLREVPV